MTVCLAMACDCHLSGTKPKLLLVMDRRLSSDVSSSETALKGRGLTKNWHCLWAGDSTTVEPIVEKSRGAVNVSSTSLEFALSGLIEAIYQKERRHRIESTLLSSYGLTIEQFLQKPDGTFPCETEANLHYNIQQFDLGCSLLVAGFQSETSPAPNMFIISNPGPQRSPKTGQ